MKTWKISLLIVLVSLVSTSFSAPQQSSVSQSPTLASHSVLSVEIGTEEVEQVRRQLDQTAVVFGEREYALTPVVVSEARTKSTVGKIELSSEAKNVLAFDSDFSVVPVTQISPSIYLVVAKPGNYLVIVETISGSTIRPIKIDGVEQPPEPTPEPTPEPIPELDGLAEYVATLTKTIGDEATRAALAAKLNSLDLSTAKTLNEATIIVQAAIETTLFSRQGESRYVNWVDQWRTPIQSKLEQMKVATLDQYREAVKQIIIGLESARPVAKPASLSVPMSFSPAMELNWQPPIGQVLVGQVHRGRVLYREGCENGQCRYVWRVIK